VAGTAATPYKVQLNLLDRKFSFHQNPFPHYRHHFRHRQAGVRIPRRVWGVLLPQKPLHQFLGVWHQRTGTPPQD